MKREVELRELFKAYDKDGSGELGNKEISQILDDFNLLPRTKTEQEEIAQILEEIDEDGSGQVELEEFRIFMQRVQEKLERMLREEEREVAQELHFTDSQLGDLRNAF